MRCLKDNISHKRISKEWLTAHGYSPLEEVRQRIEKPVMNQVEDEKLETLTQTLRHKFPIVVLEFIEYGDSNDSYPVDLVSPEIKFISANSIVLQGKLTISMNQCNFGTIEYQYYEDKFYRVSFSDKTKISKRIHSLVLRNRAELNELLSTMEKIILDERYANVKLDRLPPRSEWVTVEEMREILHKKIKEWYFGK